MTGFAASCPRSTREPSGACRGAVVNGKALLIGSGIDGLTGTAADLAAMEAALGPDGLGLAVEAIEGPAATRDGILAAYRRVIDGVGPGDVAVVYYTGHGGRVTAAPPDAGGRTPM